MTRTMYDGISGDAAAIHAQFPDAEMVAGYVDGEYAWSTAEWDLFPHATRLRISAIPGSSGAMSADVADCESGDYNPAQAAGWAYAKRKAGYNRPTIYCNLSEADAVRAATGKLILGQDYDMWLADYDGNPAQYVFSDGRKVAAKQYNDFNTYDISAVYDSAWPHRTEPNPTPTGPFRHVVPNGNTESLHAVALSRNLKSYDSIVTLSLKFLGARNTAQMNAYIAYDVAAVAAGADHAPMGSGFVYYTRND